MKHITRTVFVLSVVSLLTDMASEMLYPIMPVYLKSIGFSIVLIGVLEGVAEATAGVSKGYFGKLSDVSGRRVPFVQIGYALSAVSKPMMAIYVYPAWVFLARTIDRFGKGIRTGARDAILSDEATAQTKGKVFGFHRSLDTIGAVLGPLLALVYLYYRPHDYHTLFFIAFVPGLLAVLATFLVKDKSREGQPAGKSSQVSFFAFIRYWKESPDNYRKLVAGLLVFTLFNSSDIFLLLKAKDAGVSDSTLIGLYIFYNLVYAAVAFPVGIIADKVGLKIIFMIGLLLFSIVYAGMAFSVTVPAFIALFFVYGLYAAFTEGISKAWISLIADKKDTATAIGTYTGLQSIASLLASSITGIVWYKLGPTAAFMTTAVVALVVVAYFGLFVHRPVVR